ncbi:hypothetical protein GJR96_00640 [Haloferax sp. MBLA0076]|uniref:Uncharacterized protein n=1 Tax=Haloferax litoreum TaxID=2666140 RepID=A0A6A8GCL4_9EURY|nr:MULTISPECIES: hypothetical protein [Haloferax]KAB1192024.1 hypothetical protein Hfx1148_00640 [Haloferax sp. CBA1148]MRX20466.1 hypothetical protein [Haloferax litoreum]
MSSARAGGMICTHCGKFVDNFARHVGREECSAVGFVNRGTTGVDPHQTEFATSVRMITWDDVPTLEDAPDGVHGDDGLDDVRELADELEAEGVWPA